MPGHRPEMAGTEGPVPCAVCWRAFGTLGVVGRGHLSTAACTVQPIPVCKSPLPCAGQSHCRHNPPASCLDRSRRTRSSPAVHCGQHRTPRWNQAACCPPPGAGPRSSDPGHLLCTLCLHTPTFQHGLREISHGPGPLGFCFLTCRRRSARCPWAPPARAPAGDQEEVLTPGEACAHQQDFICLETAERSIFKERRCQVVPRETAQTTGFAGTYPRVLRDWVRGARSRKPPRTNRPEPWARSLTLSSRETWCPPEGIGRNENFRTKTATVGSILD